MIKILALIATILLIFSVPELKNTADAGLDLDSETVPDISGVQISGGTCHLEKVKNGRGGSA